MRAEADHLELQLSRGKGVAMRKPAIVDRVEVESYRIPTEQPESDGTYCWDATTLVVVHLSGGGARGIGYS